MSNNSNVFDEILSGITEASDRDTYKVLWDKYEPVRAHALRQGEFSRQMNELGEEKKKNEKKLAVVDKWEEWKKANWDDEHNATKQEFAYQQRLAELETENQNLTAKVETEMTFEDVAQEVDKLMNGKLKGVLTEDDFNKKYGTKLFDKDKYDKEVNDRVINWVAARDNMYLQLFDIGFKHKDEFGEVLDPGKVIEYANEHKIQDLKDAHDKMVALRRAEKTDKMRAEEIAAAEKRGEEKKAKELGMTQAQGGRMPTDSGAPEMSHLQQRILKRGSEKKEEQAIPDDIKLDGSGALGHKVAEFYRQDKANAA